MCFDEKVWKKYRILLSYLKKKLDGNPDSLQDLLDYLGKKINKGGDACFRRLSRHNGALNRTFCALYHICATFCLSLVLFHLWPKYRWLPSMKEPKEGKKYPQYRAQAGSFCHTELSYDRSTNERNAWINSVSVSQTSGIWRIG